MVASKAILNPENFNANWYNWTAQLERDLSLWRVNKVHLTNWEVLFIQSLSCLLSFYKGLIEKYY